MVVVARRSDQPWARSFRLYVGMAVVIQLATDVNYLLWLPLTGLFVWIVIWRVRFSTMETAFGLIGLPAGLS